MQLAKKRMGGNVMSAVSCYDKRYFKSGAEFLFDLKVLIPCSLLFVYVAFYFILDFTLLFYFHNDFRTVRAFASLIFFYLLSLSFFGPIMFFEGTRSIMFLKVYAS